MTVLLAGIGADTKNMDVPPNLYNDGDFLYIPMPEKSPDTIEEKTIGDFIDVGEVNWIYPANYDDKIKDTEKIENYPVHCDPNFEDLTYGEAGRTKYVSQIKEELSPDDVIAFYTGLTQTHSGAFDRYIIGYFTVANIDIITEDMDTSEQKRILSKHPDNAHYKRFKGNGDKLFVFDDKSGQQGMEEMVIVDGKKPGGLLDDPYKISYQNKNNNQHYIKKEFLEEYNGTVVDQNSRWNNIKKPIRLDIDPEKFIKELGNTGK